MRFELQNNGGERVEVVLLRGGRRPPFIASPKSARCTVTYPGDSGPEGRTFRPAGPEIPASPGGSGQISGQLPAWHPVDAQPRSDEPGPEIPASRTGDSGLGPEIPARFRPGTSAVHTWCVARLKTSRPEIPA